VFEFGKRREVMSQEPREPKEEKAAPNTPPAGRAGRKEIDLFPVASDRKMVAPQPVSGGNVSRLGTQISIFNPVSFEEALDIVSCLRGRSATTISLDKMKKNDAGRLVDFVSGASAALDGDFHKLTELVYVFCPSNIKIVAPTQPASTKSGTSAFDFLFSPELGGDKSAIVRRS
jgi:FtsZ-interacting cell division protein YlmF